MGKVCHIDRNADELEKLEELTERLVTPFEKIVSTASMPQVGWQEYEVEGGKAFGFNLLNIGSVAVQRVELRKGTVFPEHKHYDVRGQPVVEYGIVYVGKMKSKNFATGEEKIIGPGEQVILQRDESHLAEALEDTSLICVTIPAAEGYPANGSVFQRLRST